MYPNPASGTVFLQTNLVIDAPLKMEVYDAGGKLVSSELVQRFNPGETMELHLSETLAPGHYLLLFHYNDALIETKKLIIERAE
jgi:hypothetical protein